MGTWENERHVYEGEGKLSPQQKEEMVQEANLRREREYKRGRRAVMGMLILFSITQAFSLIVSPAPSLLAWLLSLALSVTLVYNIWHGKRWARNLFAVMLILTILITLHGMSKLNITRTDYDSQRNYSGGATLYISGLDGVKTVQELSREEISSLQESEDTRVQYHRIIMAAYLIDLAVCIGYLYILFGYRPAKEFLYGQS